SAALCGGRAPPPPVPPGISAYGYSPLHSLSQLHFSYLPNCLHLHHSRSPDYTITFPVSHTIYTSHFPHVTVGPRLTTALKLKTTAPQLVSLPFRDSQFALFPPQRQTGDFHIAQGSSSATTKSL